MKKTVAALTILAVVFSFTACTGSERLTNMTIVQGMALDYKNGVVIVTVQYLDLNKNSGKNEGISGSITSNISAAGNDIKTAIASVGKKLPDQLFFGQNKIIIISDEFERRFSRELRVYLVKNKESRPDVLVAKSSGEAKKVITELHKNTRVPADSICRQLKKAHKDVNVSEFIAGDSLPYCQNP